MENEQENIDFRKNTLNTISFYKLEYENQNVKNNFEFLKWKKEMLDEYGKNAMLFKCLEDKIYFYTSYEECKRYPIYQSVCPICEEPICYYCSRFETDEFGENGTCCLQRKIKCMFNQDCYRYIQPINYEEDILSYKEAFISFVIPVIHLFTLITQIQRIFYYKLVVKEIKKKEKEKQGLEGRYYLYVDAYDYIVMINMAMAILLVIPLFFIHIYFIIFMIIISLPFKFIPLKYLLGIHFATINLVELFELTNICC